MFPAFAAVGGRGRRFGEYRFLDNDAKGLGELRYWAQTIDGVVYGCWYRFRDDGQIEIFARGHRVVVPKEAIALLPESVARAVLAQLQPAADVSPNRQHDDSDLLPSAE
jgi:hypothetical protein